MEFTQVRPLAHVKAVIDEDGAVLLDTERGKYFSLNGIAVDIWQRMEAGLSVAQIEMELRELYDAPTEALRCDLTAFLGMLVNAHLVGTIAQP